jgi:hypothetical protein
MRKLRAVTVALLSVTVLALGSTAASAADGDPEMSRGTPSCYNEGRGLITGTNEGRCKVEVKFKPGTTLDKTWIKATFPYSIWVNGVRKKQGELTISRTSQKDGDGFFVADRIETLATFNPCDKIEIRWFEASVIRENPNTGKDEEVLRIPSGSGQVTFPGTVCSVSIDPQTTSATLPATTEPGAQTAAGGVQPL